MEDPTPPLPPTRVPLVSLTGAIGLVLAALAAAAMSALLFGTLDVTTPQRLLIAIGVIVVGLLGVGLSILAPKRSGAQWTLFVFGLLLGLGALGLAGLTTLESVQAFGTATSSIPAPSQKPNPVKIATQPIPQVEGNLTSRDVEKYFRSWVEEKVQKGYDAHGSHDPKWDKTAREFLGGAVLAGFSFSGGSDPDRLRTLAEELDQAGCDDPLVGMIKAGSTNNPGVRESLFRTAAEKLTKRGYAPGLIFLCRSEIWALNSRQPSVAESLMATEAIAALKAELSAAPLAERDYWVWNYVLTTGAPGLLMTAKGEPVLAALDPLTTVEPWFKKRFLGEIEISRAWAARGDGYADTVTEAGWAGFKRHLELASTALTDSWQAHPQHPAAAQLMISVKMGQGHEPLEEMRKWFDRAVSARIDYSSAYSSLLWGMRPRWFGSHPAMLAFGKACADTKRFDTMVPWEYFVAVHDAASECDQPDSYYRELAPYAELRDLCQQYIHEPKAPEPPAFYLSHLALMAGAAGHREEALAALKQIDFKLTPEVAQSWEIDPEPWVGAYLARSGATGEQVKQAELDQENGEYTAALDLVNHALETAGVEDAAKDYLKTWAAELKELQPMDRIPWTPYLPPVGDKDVWQKAGWIGVRGHWTQPDAQTIELTGDSTTETLVHSNMAPGASYELRGEMELPTESTTISNAAITMGWPEDSRDVWLTVRLRRTSQGDSVVFSHEMGEDRVFPVEGRLPRRKFLLRVVDRHLHMVVDGVAIVDTDFRPPGDVSGQPPVLGFGTPRSKNPATVRFHNIEWRRLDGIKRPEPAKTAEATPPAAGWLAASR